MHCIQARSGYERGTGGTTGPKDEKQVVQTRTVEA